MAKLIIDKIVPVEGTDGMLNRLETHIDESQPSDLSLRDFILAGDYDPFTRVLIKEAMEKVYGKEESNISRSPERK